MLKELQGINNVLKSCHNSVVGSLDKKLRKNNLIQIKLENLVGMKSVQAELLVAQLHVDVALASVTVWEHSACVPEGLHIGTPQVLYGKLSFQQS